MLRTTLGQVLVNSQLPPDLRDYTRTLDKKGIGELFQAVGDRHPEEYRDVAKRLHDIAGAAAYQTAGFSFGLKHMLPGPAAERHARAARAEIDAIQARRDLSRDQKDQAVVDALVARQKPAEEDVYKETLAEKNPLGLQVLSGTRGNESQLKSLRAGDYLYEDHHGKPIPIPVLTPYSHGLSPVEYWAGAYGARTGVIAEKFATQQAGFLSKQLGQVSHRLVVTDRDAEEEPEPGTIRGLPVDTEDPDNDGALLAHPVGGYPRNTLLTPAVRKELAAAGHGRILVRSPTVGGPDDGGVYSRDVGVRERGGLAPRGDFVGLAAAQALAEKITQGQLSAKHAGGVAGSDRAVQGFSGINNLVQVPETYAGTATHANRAGRVTSIEPAPQGGHTVTIAGTKHYVPADLKPAVALGDQVEPGDVLSDGLPNPAQIVRHKGIGEGRRYFIDVFRRAFRASGMYGHRRNIELLARGLIDHVRMTDEHGEFLPDDVVHYQQLESAWRPREGARSLDLNAAVGKYLEAPVLHHTIGTQVHRSMLPELKHFGVGQVLVHDDPPPFEPEMIRGMASLQHDPDWMTRHLGSNLAKGTLQAVHRGGVSDTAGTSYVPAAALRPSFGLHGKTRPWNPEEVEHLPRDADSDGRIAEGTPAERAIAPPRHRRLGLLAGLGSSGS